MNLDGIITKNLTKAFSLSASLLTPATFHLGDGTGFDFGSATTTVSGQEDKVVDVLVVKTSNGLQSVRKQLLLERIEGLDVYDTVTLGTEVFSIGQTILDDGYMQIIEVYHG